MSRCVGLFEVGLEFESEYGLREKIAPGVVLSCAVLCCAVRSISPRCRRYVVSYRGRLAVVLQIGVRVRNGQNSVTRPDQVDT